MAPWLLVALMVAGGTFIAFQSPINAQLAHRIGVFEAAFTSFSVGTLLALFLVLTVGRGSLRALPSVPAFQWVGGLLGMGYVTLVILCVPRLGVTTVMVAALVGQLVTGALLDHFGVLGVPHHPLGWTRVAGIALLFAAIGLIQSGK